MLRFNTEPEKSIIRPHRPLQEYIKSVNIHAQESAKKSRELYNKQRTKVDRGDL